MAKANDIILHYGDGSPPCWAVQIALEEKGITEYQSKKYSFAKFENKSEQVLALNPRGELPCFQIGDLIINESAAVCLHLEEAFADQGTRLLPTDLRQRAVVWQRLFEFSWNLIRRCYKHYVKYLWCTPTHERDASYVLNAKNECLAELSTWDKHLSGSNGKFLGGDSFGICDVVAFPWLAFFEVLGLNYKLKFTNIAAYLDRLRNRPSFKKFWPETWDGTPDINVLQHLNEG